jgi:Leu/Phe-tRNA-protein transferase
MKTETELLELYANAYKERNAEAIQEYVAPVISYKRPGKPAFLMVKSEFLSYLQTLFDIQKQKFPQELMGISIVHNKVTGKENMYIEFGMYENVLFSIESTNGMYENISISKYNNEDLITKKTVLERLIGSLPEKRPDKPLLQKSSKFSYFNNGFLIIKESDNPEDVMDAIINTNYPYESCIGENFKPEYLMSLVKSGFYIMSRYDGYLHTYNLEAMHHLSRSVLFFDRLHIKKSIKKYFSKYELRFNTDFDTIVDKCVKNHNDAWLTKPLVDSIKKIHELNKEEVNFVSFGLYRDNKLVAGDFGSKVGRIYSSYSGYYEESNAGTVQMILTAQYLEKEGFAFWDLGMPVDYKKTIGGRILNLEDFISLWRKYSNEEIKPGLEPEKRPVIKAYYSEEELLHILKCAYKYHYIDDLQDFLSDDFKFSSQFNNSDIDSKEKYLAALKNEIKGIKYSSSPGNVVYLEIVESLNRQKPCLLYKRDRLKALFVIQTEHNKIKRIDLCNPTRFRFTAKEDRILIRKAYICLKELGNNDSLKETEKNSIIKYIKTVAYYCCDTPGYIQKFKANEKYICEQRHTYDYEGTGKSFIKAYKMLLEKPVIFPAFVYFLVEEMRKTAGYLNLEDRRKMIDEMSIIINKFGYMEYSLWNYLNAMYEYIQLEESEGEIKKYSEIIIEQAMKNKKRFKIMSILHSLLLHLMVYHYALFEEYYNNDVGTIIKRFLSEQSFNSFIKQKDECKKIFMRRQRQEDKENSNYLYYSFISVRNEIKTHNFSMSVRKNEIYFENICDYRAMEGDEGGYDELYATINDCNYGRVINRIQRKYKPMNYVFLPEDVKTYFDNNNDKRSKVLVQYIFAIYQSMKNDVWGGGMMEILCGEEIPYEHTDFFKMP